MKKLILFTLMAFGGALMAAPNAAHADSIHIRGGDYHGHGGGKHWNRGHDRHWNDHRRYRQPVVYYQPPVRTIVVPSQPVMYVPQYQPYYYQPSGLSITYRW